MAEALNDDVAQSWRLEGGVPVYIGIGTVVVILLIVGIIYLVRRS